MESNVEKSPKKKRTIDQTIRGADRLVVVIGYVMILMSAGIFLGITYFVFRRGVADVATDVSIISWFVTNYSGELLALFAAIILGRWGMRLVGAIVPSRAPPSVIPDDDRKLLERLIKDGGDEAVKYYIAISSLSGATGTFQKIGFSGLPLATVLLTLIFCSLHFAQVQFETSATNHDFLELAKLTTGAFIGSFVQKGADVISKSRSPDHEKNDLPTP